MNTYTYFYRYANGKTGSRQVTTLMAKERFVARLNQQSQYATYWL